MKDTLLKMMKDLIDGKYDCNDFSYDFPYAMFGIKDQDLLKLLDDMPEICASYDPYLGDEPGLLDDTALRQKVKEVYKKALIL